MPNIKGGKLEDEKQREVRRVRTTNFSSLKEPQPDKNFYNLP